MSEQTPRPQSYLHEQPLQEPLQADQLSAHIAENAHLYAPALDPHMENNGVRVDRSAQAEAWRPQHEQSSEHHKRQVEPGRNVAHEAVKAAVSDAPAVPELSVGILGKLQLADTPKAQAEAVAALPLVQQQAAAEWSARQGNGWILSKAPELSGVQDWDRVGDQFVARGTPQFALTSIDLMRDKAKFVDAALEPANYRQFRDAAAAEAAALENAAELLRQYDPALHTYYDPGAVLAKGIAALTRQKQLDQENHSDHNGGFELVYAISDHRNRLADLPADLLPGLVTASGANIHGLRALVPKFQEGTFEPALLAAAKNEFVRYPRSESGGLDTGNDSNLFMAFSGLDSALQDTKLSAGTARELAGMLAEASPLEFASRVEAFAKAAGREALDLGLIARALGSVHDSFSGAELQRSLKKSSASLDPAAARVLKTSLDKLDTISPTVVHAIRDISGGELTEKTRALGISEPGTKGEQQLWALVEQYRRQYLNPDMATEELRQMLHEPLRREVFRTVMRTDVKEWGGHDERTFQNEITNWLEAAEDDRIAPLPEGYEPSEVFQIREIKQKERPQWDEDVLKRYQGLMKDIAKAWDDRLDSVAEGADYHHSRQDPEYALPRVLSPIGFSLMRLSGAISGEVANLDEGLAGEMPENQREAMQARRDQLQALITPDPKNSRYTPLRSLKNFEQNFMSLAKSKSLHDPLRQAVFSWAMMKHPELTIISGDLIRLGSGYLEPTAENMSTMVNMVEHIVNQETFADYFANKKAASVFRELTNVKALQQALDKLSAQSEDSEKTLPLQFIPTRGIMHQQSGALADACWDGSVGIISDTMPNMTTFVMKARPGQDSERLAGAGLLIETHDTITGEPTLVLRGINPQENVIRKIDNGQFFDAVLAYGRRIADARGMKLAIVIDDHAGGATTNRPGLYGYIRGWQRSVPALTKITVPNDEFEFNGYSLYKVQRGNQAGIYEIPH